MRILSFDISASPGVALIEIKNGKPRLLAVDHLETDSKLTDAQRFHLVEAFVINFVYKHVDKNGVQAIVREKFHRGGSKRGTQLVFGAWASVDRALAAFGYTIEQSDEIVASTVKRLVGGRGNAEKDEVAAGVIRILDGTSKQYFYTDKGRLLDDRSDAVAIGLAYAIQNGLIKNEGSEQ